MEWKDLIQPELLALMPFLYGAGVLIKNTPFIKDWLIPYILWGLSTVITIIYFVLQLGSNFDGAAFAAALSQATLLSFATVGGNECIKQAVVKRKLDNGNNSKIDSAEETQEQNKNDQDISPQ
ncbi:MAG TPA: phage holin family protein [Clostridia bacterium]